MYSFDHHASPFYQKAKAGPKEHGMHPRAQYHTKCHPITLPNGKWDKTMRRDVDTFALIEPLNGIWHGMRGDFKLERFHHGIESHISTTPTINDERTNLPSNCAPCMKDSLPLFQVILSGKSTQNPPNDQHLSLIGSFPNLLHVFTQKVMYLALQTPNTLHSKSLDQEMGYRAEGIHGL